MTARQPFTSLCQALARPRLGVRVDLHLHTTFSDGAYTPEEIVNLAKRSGLPALAITDHDTIDGVAPARQAAGTNLEVVAGVEITTSHQGQIYHLLGYFFRLEDKGLQDALCRLRRGRLERFREMVNRLDKMGIQLPEMPIPNGTLCRRHLAQLLVDRGKVGTVREAFLRYLGDSGPVAVPCLGLPLAEAIQVVRGAGGVAGLAHPSYDCTRGNLRELRDLGLQAVEVEFPACKASRTRELRGWARELGLAVTGGSDCHGPGCGEVGRCSISWEELEKLRALPPEVPASCSGKSSVC